MSKPQKQKESGAERQLAVIGQQQITASHLFDGAHKAVLDEAKTDQSNLFRGRLTGDTWQQLRDSISTGASRVATGDGRKAGGFEGLAGDAVGSALREGTRRAQELKDERIKQGMSSRLSNVGQSMTSVKQAARTEFEESAQKAKIASDWNNELAGGAMTLASMGAGSYMNGQYTKGADVAAKGGALSGPGGQSYYNSMGYWQKQGYNDRLRTMGLGG